MSIRTVVEINHDRLKDLENPENVALLLRHLRANFGAKRGEEIAPGVRWFGQRHHSERIAVEVE